MVTTVAGASANMGLGGAPAVDMAGNVYLPDQEQGVIRAVTPEGLVAVVSGTALIRDGVDGIGSTARFNRPAGLAADAVGNVYVADSGNAAIRKILAGARVTTIAGVLGQAGSDDGTPGTARFKNPTSLAFGLDGSLYVAEDAGTDIRRIAPTGEVTTLKGFPGNVVAADAQGNVYAGSAADRLIRVRNARGEVSVLTGYGQPGFDENDAEAAARFSPSGMVTDGAGNLYVSDLGNFTIRRISPDGRSTTVAGQAGKASPRIVDAVDGIGSAALFAAPGALAMNSDGDIFVADGTYAGSISIGLCTSGHTAFSNCLLKFTNVSNAIRRVSPDGSVVTVVGKLGSNDIRTGPLPGTLTTPTGLAFDKQGTLYVSTEAAVLRVDWK